LECYIIFLMSNFNTRPRLQDRDFRQLSGDSITLSGETNISGTFRYLPGAVTGYVLSSLDNNGTVTWLPSGTGSFTGNTSASCITDLYVSNIHSCSPLNINPLDEGNVYFGSTSGVTIDINNNRLGVNNPSPQYVLDVFGTTNERLQFITTSPTSRLLVSTDQSNTLTRIGVNDDTNNGGIEFGFRGTTEPTFVNYGKQGDSFIRSSNNSNGINIIDAPTTFPNTKENYIRFYAGQNATSINTPDIHIQGSGSTRGNVGINTANPSEKLDVNGKTRTSQLQVTTSPVNGYVLTSDANGNATWQPSGGSSTFTGNTSASCITDLYISNLYGCSPITVWDSIQSVGSTASGTTSFAFGINNVSSGIASFAEGGNNIASGDASHAEGIQTTAIGSASHAEGGGTNAIGIQSHAEGKDTLAVGNYSHAEGQGTESNGNYSHAEGNRGVANGESSHVEGYATSATTQNAHAEGYQTLASGNNSHAEGYQTIASGNHSHSEGYQTVANGDTSHAEGVLTVASGDYSHAEGQGTVASGYASHSEGDNTTASGVGSHAGGTNSISSGIFSFIHSSNSLVSGDRSVVLGGQNITGTTIDTVYVPDFVIKKSAAVPTNSADSVGENGSITWDNTYFYWKANGQWLRVSGSTF
jgi:hypothetical protein